MDTKSEKIALFRYGLVATFVIEVLPRGELSRRAREIASRQYDIPYSKRNSVCVDTLLQWAARYRQGGFEALAPHPRQDRGKSRVITPQIAGLDRTPQTRKPLPHRHHTAPGTCSFFRTERSRGVLFYAVPIPQAARADRAPTPRSPGCIRSSKRSSAMMSGSRTCFTVPTSSAPAAAKCRFFFMPFSMTPAAHSLTASFIRTRDWTAALDCFRQAVGARGLPVRLLRRQCKNLPLAAAGSDCGIDRHPCRPYAPVSTRRARKNRKILPPRPRAVPGQSRPQTNPVLARTSTPDSRPGSTTPITAPNIRPWEPHRSCVGSAISNKSACSLRRPTSAASSSIASTAWCVRIALSCCRTVSMRLRPIWQDRPLRCVSIPWILSQVEIYFQGQPQGSARLVDPIVNAQLPFVEAEGISGTGTHRNQLCRTVDQQKGGVALCSKPSSVLRNHPSAIAPMPNSCLPRRLRIRSRPGSSFWSIIAAPGC